MTIADILTKRADSAATTFGSFAPKETRMQVNGFSDFKPAYSAANARQDAALAARTNLNGLVGADGKEMAPPLNAKPGLFNTVVGSPFLPMALQMLGVPMGSGPSKRYLELRSPGGMSNAAAPGQNLYNNLQAYSGI